MNDLRVAIGTIVASAFESIGLSSDLGRVSTADRPDLADFQCNGAMAAAKKAGKNPREIATQIVDVLSGNELFSRVDVAGPGFINIVVSDQTLSARVDRIAGDARLGANLVPTPRRVIVDYGGPNVAKPMHVGHLRASIIGESLKRLYRFRGDEVLGDAHFGDWGFQMGLLIVAVGDENPDLVAALSEGRTDDAAAMLEQQVDLQVLDRLYPQAAGRAKSDPDYRDRARKATAELQNGDAGHRQMWQRFVEVSRAALEREFDALGIHFDLWKGESDVNDLIEPMVAELKAANLLELDQGAQILRVAREGDKRELPPLLVISSEGSAMYGTTDLATVLDRRRSFDPHLMIYCVDQRQADHFEQVFRAAEKAGYAVEGSLEHVGFGTMNGTDGKPFKTREGGVLKLHDLIEMTREKARGRLREAGLGAELSADAFEATAHRVAVAALKFADLSNFRGTSYVFDLDRFTSFEGKTGPYLLYQAVRIKSVLRRAESEGAAAGKVEISDPAERELALLLDSFDHALSEAYERKAPHFIAEHAYRLAQSFSRFYSACPIMSAPSQQTRASRLNLAGTCLGQLTLALDLLGIETPDRM